MRKLEKGLAASLETVSVRIADENEATGAAATWKLHWLTARRIRLEK